MARYRISGYAMDGRYVGPEEIDTDDLNDALTHPERHPFKEIQTPVYVETWTDGRWVPND